MSMFFNFIGHLKQLRRDSVESGFWVKSNDSACVCHGDVPQPRRRDNAFI